jgi:hypothetical protein
MEESIYTGTQRSYYDYIKIENIEPVLKKHIIHDSKNVIVKFKSLQI